jgi:proteasome activator subunit 4
MPTPAQMINAVTGACCQICTHLSEPLYDRVLDMIFDYTTTNVRPNAVRVIGLLVQCVARVNPSKTLLKFLPFCCSKIRIELEHGASFERTTSILPPVPSDATLHWR